MRRSNTNSQKGYLWIGPNVDEENLPPERVITYRPDAPGVRQRKK